jgi:outer membrane protein OmpA-like peptidoglycan-associated protein
MLLFHNLAMAQQNLTADDLVKSLQASSSPASPAVRSIDVEHLRDSLQNGLSVEPRDSKSDATGARSGSLESTASSINHLPSVSIEIFFDYNSANLRPEAVGKLMVLGQALQDSRLKGQRFLIAGHTDGAGSREYNLKLSQHRAEAIKLFLTSAFPLEPQMIAAIGFGKEQLKDPANPDAAVNRRVQVINITQ